MAKGSERIAQAIINGEKVGLESDYDQDGLGAMACMRLAFIDVFNHPEEQLRSYVGHRLRDGYGLCDALAERILEEDPLPSVLITADNGSSDEARIGRLKEAGIDVVVTDHHAIPIEGVPKSAYACINPQQEGCEYPDGAIAGGMVAWLLMCSVRKRLIENDHMDAGGNPLGKLLDFVACSTVADCVSMASTNNRALVKYGLRLMNKTSRPCWDAMRPMIKTREIRSETIAFGIAPRVNAQTRLNSADEALKFLLAEDVEEASRYASILDKNNEERKRIEKEMVEDAICLASEQVAGESFAIVTMLKDGHPGVQGICSSRILERYGRPTFTFCPNADDKTILTGSGRSGEMVHIRDALQAIEEESPGLMVKFGGHKAAAGVTIEAKRFREFASLFEAEAARRMKGHETGPVALSDGELTEDELCLGTLDELSRLEPTGRGFELAQFDGVFTVDAIRPVGDGTHLKIQLRTMSNRIIPGIWFRARRNADAPIPVERNKAYRFLYKLADNNGYGRRRIEVQVVSLLAGNSD
jgi:single-stranded-DNA-specific exonuclease